jgi:dTDP-4-amino-4,6-dideoxygalactose transaminase
MVTTDDEDLAWNARSFRDHGYDVKERLDLLELEQKLPYIHNMVGWNYRMTEMQSAIGLAELGRMDTWNMPNRRRNARTITRAVMDLPQVKYMPVDTPERQNGWYVMAFSLDIENMSCDIAQFVAAASAEGAPCWKVFWPQCHTEKAYTQHNAFGRSGFPFESREYADPESVEYSKVEVPNAIWHQDHTFTCFAFPTFTEDDCQQIGAAVRKVIQAYAR